MRSCPLAVTVLSIAALLTIATLVGCAEPASHPDPDAPDDPSTGQPAAASVTANRDRVAGHPLLRTCADDQGLIRPTPASFPDHLSDGFDRYAEVLAPNGKPIRIFAQDRLSDEQIHRAVNVLRFFLEGVPGSRFGADKAAVADSMANHGAVLLLPNGAHREAPDPKVDGQPLFDSELPVEGSAWYQENDWQHRDATFEEIFHLVHDYGIGTFIDGALPDYQALLHTAALEALEAERWGMGAKEWIDELAAEGSLAQEYIASVLDTYFGLWGPWDGEGGMHGIYVAKVRDDLASRDSRGRELLEMFLGPWLTFEARLAREFQGTFSMVFDPARPYTHKSRYLTQATLTGEHDAGIRGNDQDNVFRGNAGNNTIDGGEGHDTVVYCRPRGDFQIVPRDGAIEIVGNGRDRLTQIETLQFTDAAIDLATFQGGSDHPGSDHPGSP